MTSCHLRLLLWKVVVANIDTRMAQFLGGQALREITNDGILMAQVGIGEKCEKMGGSDVPFVEYRGVRYGANMYLSAWKNCLGKANKKCEKQVSNEKCSQRLNECTSRYFGTEAINNIATFGYFQ